MQELKKGGRKSNHGEEGRENRCRIRWDDVRSAASALLCSSLICHLICRDCRAQNVSFLHHIKRGQIIPKWRERGTEEERQKVRKI